ncbi:hypothetical protein LEMLEM_LOCUS7340, partial [Lemmus lemmus]
MGTEDSLRALLRSTVGPLTVRRHPSTRKQRQ